MQDVPQIANQRLAHPHHGVSAEPAACEPKLRSISEYVGAFSHNGARGNCHKFDHVTMPGSARPLRFTGKMATRQQLFERRMCRSRTRCCGRQFLGPRLTSRGATVGCPMDLGLVRGDLSVMELGVGEVGGWRCSRKRADRYFGNRPNLKDRLFSGS